MRSFGFFLLGILALLILEAAAGGIVLKSAHGWTARDTPTRIERWLARAARHAAIPSDAKMRTNPVPNTPENIAEARAHWADHCATCHANDGSGEIKMGQSMYPHAPDMRNYDTQHLSDGELFYIIQNGVRLTGMPAWKLVHFIRRLPSLTTEEKLEMEMLNPKGPEDRKEEEEEQKFLRGDTTDAPDTHHH